MTGESDWKADLIKNKEGVPLPELTNVMLALEYAPELKDIVALDLMNRRIMVMRGVPQYFNVKEPEPITDIRVTEIQRWFQDNGFRRLGRDVVQQAVEAEATNTPTLYNTFKPNPLSSAAWKRKTSAASAATLRKRCVPARCIWS